jgi:putative transposase
VTPRRAGVAARVRSPHLPNTWYYKSRARDAVALWMRIREIAQARPRCGYVRIWIIVRREGWPDNKKRIHRLLSA